MAVALARVLATGLELAADLAARGNGIEARFPLWEIHHTRSGRINFEKMEGKSNGMRIRRKQDPQGRTGSRRKD